MAKQEKKIAIAIYLSDLFFSFSFFFFFFLLLLLLFLLVIVGTFLESTYT